MKKAKKKRAVIGKSRTTVVLMVMTFAMAITALVGFACGGNPDSPESGAAQFQRADKLTSKENQGDSVGNPHYEDGKLSVEGSYDDPSNPLAEQTYRVGEPRYEDGEPVAEGCYDDPSNPLSEQTYQVGEPRYE